MTTLSLIPSKIFIQGLKFIEYNIIDVELVDRLEDKMKVDRTCITMSYDAKVNYNDVFYQVRMWDTIIYNYLKKRNNCNSSKNRSSKAEKYAGAYERTNSESMIGLYLLTGIVYIHT